MTVGPFGNCWSSLRGSPQGDRSNPSSEIASSSAKESWRTPRNDVRKTVLFGALNWFFFFVLFSPFPVQAETKSPLTIFQDANAAYRGGDYVHAASLYESLIAGGARNAGIYYNLANAYFKQDQLGAAILYYEKAKRLAPRDRDIAVNLGYVRGLLEYRIEDKRNWYVKTGEAALRSFTLREIGIASLALGMVCWLSWAFCLYVRPESSWGFRRKTLLTFTLIGFSLWFLKAVHDATGQEAIVTKPQAQVRYGPSHKDQVAFRLGEGLKVRVKRKAGEWSRVVLINGETGWMDQEEIGVI